MYFQRFTGSTSRSSLAVAFAAILPFTALAKGRADELARDDPFVVFRDTTATLPDGASLSLRRGWAGHIIEPGTRQVVAFSRGTKLRIDRSDIVFGDAGIARASEEIGKKPSDWPLRLIRAQLYAEARKLDAAIADIDAIPRDAPEFAESVFLRAIFHSYQGEWKAVIDGLRAYQRDHSEAIDKVRLASTSAWMGVAHSMLGQHVDAVKEFDAAIAGGMNDVQTRYWRALALWETKRFDESIDTLRHALELDPDDDRTRWTLVEAIARRSGFSVAIAEANRNVDRDPARTGSRVVRAKLFLAYHQFDAAMADVQHVLMAAPNHVEANLIKARVLYVRQDRRELEKHCETLASLSIASPEYLALRAHYFESCSRFDDAFADVNRAIERSRPDSGLLVQRCRLWVRQANWDRVIADATRAIELRPDNHSAYAMRCVGNTWKGRYNRALSDINRAMTLKEGSAEYHYYRGQVLRHLDRTEEALADLRTAAHQSPPNHEYVERLALALISHRRRDEAIIVLSQLNALGGDASSRWIARARMWEEKGNYWMSIADLTEALQVRRANPSLLAARARAYCAAKRFDLALVDMTSAEKIGPLDVNGAYWKGKVYEGLGEYAQAVKVYEELANREVGLARSHFGLARVLSTAANDDVRDGERALDHAKAACEAMGWRDPEAMSYLAAAYAELGEFDEAVEWQTKALALARDLDREEVAKVLELYRAEKPYRQTPIPRVAAKVE